MSKNLVLTGLLLLCTAGCDNATKQGERSPDRTEAAAISYSVTNTLPHDTLSFTEGLLMHNGQLVESTGSPDERSETP